MLEILEKVIRDYRLPAPVKGRLRRLARQYLALEDRVGSLLAKSLVQEGEIRQLRAEVMFLQSRYGLPSPDRACGHCGSPNICVTGSRPDSSLGDPETRIYVYKCSQCGGETTVVRAV